MPDKKFPSLTYRKRESIKLTIELVFHIQWKKEIF